MFVRTGTQFYPVWSPADGDGSSTVAAGTGSDTVAGGQGSDAFDGAKAFAGLEADNRDWLGKAGLDKDPVALAKHAFNQEKLLGSAIRVPGKDATPEERNAYLTKLGRPEKAEGYDFAMPKDLPKDLPYDGERATAFKAKAYELGLTKEQAANLHDWYVENSVKDFTGFQGQQTQQLSERATKATEDLVKLWGPLDGKTAQANLEIADKVFKLAPGGPEVLAELKSLGLVGPNKEILSVPLAKMFAGLGTALYTEDGVLRGQPDDLENPFAEGSASFNVTKQMALVKTDRDKALTMIAAVGKKPSDFGLV
jgi:hypothetical protein